MGFVTEERRHTGPTCSSDGTLRTAITAKEGIIPKLELMSYLTLSRLYNTCKGAIEFAQLSDAKTVFWMDSQTVLAWIKTPPKRYKPFVSVRVVQIQETLDTQAFRYIRSGVNPTQEAKSWMEGPPFL